MSECIEQYYSQGRDKRWDASSITSNGVCLALSAFWIRRKAMAGIDDLQFWDWLGVKPNAVDREQQGSTPQAINFLNEQNAVFELMYKQSLASSIAKKQGLQPFADLIYPLITELIERDINLKRMDLFEQRDASQERIIRALTKYYYHPGQRTYYQFACLHGKAAGEGWGHVIATAYEQRGRVYLYDANYGEISWSNCSADHGAESVNNKMHELIQAYLDDGLYYVRNLVFR